MSLRLHGRFLFIVIVGLHAVAPTRAQTSRPRLIALLVVDQMRGDYVDKFQHQWTGGLHRLLADGAWFRQVDYPFFDTLTCPGHSTIATGTLPSIHGMVLNVWWDPAKQAEARCTQDQSTTFVSYGKPVAGAADSAANLRVSTIGDELRAQSSTPAHVISFSLKARAAIGLAGHKPDVVTWFDDSGTWVTSSAFTRTPVPEVVDFVRAHPIVTDDYNRWQTSPRSDEYLAEMALDVAKRRHFEAGDATNMIAISFSALDRVGHAFGPESDEVRNTLARLDRTLGVLLSGLDRLVGAGNYTVALLADHGVAPVPEEAHTQGLNAGRMTPEEFTRQLEAVFQRVAGPGHYVAHVVSTHVYLAPGVFDRLRERSQLAAVRTGIHGLPFVADVYTRDQIESARPDNSTAGKIARSYDPQRSGDLTVVLPPYWIAYADATTHGTAYGYDTRVPLMLMGKGIRPGQYFAPASPLDVAPTLAFLAGVTLPRAQGRVLIEALRPAATPFTSSRRHVPNAVTSAH